MEIKKVPLVSICIPSYNRPEELKRLLFSIDGSYHHDIQIVICEDFSPKRMLIREIVMKFKSLSKYETKYIENMENYGYDRNLRELIGQADGEFILYMGDDDIFVQGVLDNYMLFLKDHRHCGYILRSYRNLNANGTMEYFRYYKGNIEFESGVNTYVELFDKSVFISGFCFKKSYGILFLTDELDGSLLFQLYLLAELCMRHKAAYFNTPLTQAFIGNSTPMFGSSLAEKSFYSPGAITVQNSLNFIRKYFEVIELIDKKNNLHTKNIVIRNMSKYSYPIISIQRHIGIAGFIIYVKELHKIGLSKTLYFWLYSFLLLILGKRVCDFGIRFLKRLLGKRPVL